MVFFKTMTRSKMRMLLKKRKSIIIFLAGFFTLPVVALTHFLLFTYLPAYIQYKCWRIEEARYHDAERMRTYFFDNRLEFEEMEKFFQEDRSWDFVTEKRYGIDVFIHGDLDEIDLYGIDGRYLDI